MYLFHVFIYKTHIYDHMVLIFVLSDLITSKQH